MTKREELAMASFAVTENERRVLEYEPRTWEEVSSSVRCTHFAHVDALLEALMEPSEHGLSAQRIENSYFLENMRKYLRAIKDGGGS